MQIHMINVEKYGFWLSEFATVMNIIKFGRLDEEFSRQSAKLDTGVRIPHRPQKIDFF